MDAGLDSLPGGGGEIFAPHVRRKIGIGKASAEQWLDVMATAHRLGMFTSATMMFGHIEGAADRIMHLDAIRQRQDEAIENDYPGRYVSFISWPFQRENTPLGHLPDWDAESAGDAQFPGDVLAEAVLRGEVDPHDKAACGRVGAAGGQGREVGGRDPSTCGPRRSAGCTSTTSPASAARGSPWVPASANSGCTTAPTTWAA